MAPTRPISIALFLVSCAAIVLATQGKPAAFQATEYERERTVGNRLETSIHVLEWKATEPTRSNLFVYSVAAPRLDEELMRRVARAFDLNGDIEQIPGETLGHIGFRIQGKQQPQGTNGAPSVFFWLTMGSFGYSSGYNPYAWDLKNHKPLGEGVPTKEEAMQRALDLLPRLGLSPVDLEQTGSGTPRWDSSVEEIRYVDKTDKRRKKAVVSRTVTFYQKMPGGGTTISVGDGGALRFTFVSNGKVGSIEWFFRKLTRIGAARSKTRKELLLDLKGKKAWTWHERMAPSVVITNCALAYPQGNSWLDQKYVAPFYMLTGTDADGRAVTLYVPLEWEQKN